MLIFRCAAVELLLLFGDVTVLLFQAFNPGLQIGKPLFIFTLSPLPGLQVLASLCQPQVLFSDVVLPDRSGLELACEVASRNPGTQIVLTSGYAGEKSRQTSIDEHGMRFLRKPYSLGDLLEMLRTVIEDGEDGIAAGDPPS